MNQTYKLAHIEYYTEPLFKSMHEPSRLQLKISHNAASHLDNVHLDIDLTWQIDDDCMQQSDPSITTAKQPRCSHTYTIQSPTLHRDKLPH